MLSWAKKKFFLFKQNSHSSTKKKKWISHKVQSPTSHRSYNDIYFECLIMHPCFVWANKWKWRSNPADAKLWRSCGRTAATSKPCGDLMSWTNRFLQVQSHSSFDRCGLFTFLSLGLNPLLPLVVTAGFCRLCRYVYTAPCSLRSRYFSPFQFLRDYRQQYKFLTAAQSFSAHLLHSVFSFETEILRKLQTSQAGICHFVESWPI